VGDRRYRDYEVEEPSEVPLPPSEAVEPADAAVFVMPVFEKSRKMHAGGDPNKIAYWSGSLQGHRVLDEFDGTREEVVEWAKATGARTQWIYDLDRKDLVPLT